MEKPIEQTLSKQTLQFGLRPEDYLVLVIVATFGSFFISKFWLAIIVALLVFMFQYVNKRKRRFFWSSLYIWLFTNKNLIIKQTKKLPPVFKN
ncbi:hypothetical protein GWO43_27355 [candidate division KSB1 bacterium]|nr:hypothetical protein [candidate division KSB1 bacterium]NIR70501.1 hypothetical protein [candidate division KSB1 bacterium]NIS27676.1 hypothetical protein [candidate division KSB1 bacterium]NIT74511.1 hypothetical protein [candidate division KSB1 bacterium]NIU23750.1 hypothetical protein [candidate division KSB1 bacterium]